MIAVFLANSPALVSAWPGKGGAHKTADQLINNKTIKPAIIAMPSDGLWGDGSAYFSHHQKQFDKWIVEDVITAVRENIPQAKNSTSTCIGGGCKTVVLLISISV